jgi:hypothetical protein
VWLLANWGRGNDIWLTWIHPGLMLVAAGLAHAGKTLAERTAGSKAKGGKAALFFGASFILILVGIPLASWPL